MKPLEMARGVVPPLLTPFTDDGKVDVGGIKSVADWMIEEGSHVLFPVCGTGEMFSLSVNEACTVASEYYKAAAGRVPVIATGTLSKMDPKGCVEGVKRMEATGIDAVVVLSPDHLENSDEDAYFDYYKAMSDAVSCPLWVYELPGRPKIPPSLFGRLAELDHYIGVKDTTIDFDQIKGKIAAAKGKFNVLQAGDHIFLESMEVGCTGVCAVGVNIFPSIFRACYDAFQEGDMDRAKKSQEWLIELWGRMKPHPEFAKKFLGKIGLGITPLLRRDTAPFTSEQQENLDKMPDLVAQAKEEVSA